MAAEPYRMTEAARFSQRAAKVVNGVYFYPPFPPTEDPDELTAWHDRREAESDKLVAALRDCQTYDDLKGEPKEIFDRAELDQAHWDDDETVRDRMGGDGIGYVLHPDAQKLLDRKAKKHAR